MADGASAKSKYFRILSIDGGGIRGIIPGQILVAVEKKLQDATENPDARIADFFDLIAGTSTGGILACAYLTPRKEDRKKKKGGRPQFSARDAVEIYTERGDEVFDIPLWHKVSSGAGVFDEKYPSDGLEEVLEDKFGDLLVGELLKPFLIPAYDIRRRKTKFFTRPVPDTPGQDYYVKDVARATSAAPTFFEAARIKSQSQIPYPLIDGGVFANNPALCAYAEARGMKWGSGNASPTAKDMVILSLGTGVTKKSYDYKSAKNWGMAEWIRPVLDIMMSGVSETVHYQLDKIYDAVGASNQYLRIDPDLQNASPDMDNATEENLIALRDAGQEAAQLHGKKIDAFVKLLRA